MTKSERLLFILNLFRVKKSVKINELAHECGVSNRTVYRDLQSLIGLDIPLYCNDGYELVNEISMPTLNFTREEQELLGYCLMSSPLMRSQRFGELLRSIELKVISAMPDLKGDRLNILITGPEKEIRYLSNEFSDNAAICLKALINKNKLKILFRSGKLTLDRIRPVSLQITEKKWRLFVAEKEESKAVGIPLEEINKIEIVKD